MHGTAAEIALRNAAIVAQLHSGEKVKDVAAQHDLTTRQVQRIVRDFEMRPTSLEQTPMEIVERVLRTYEEQLTSFALVAAEMMAKQPAVAIAALRARADSLERYRELLTDLGKLPSNLELFKGESELLRMGSHMLELFRQAESGELEIADARPLLEDVMDVIARRRLPGSVDGTARELPSGGDDG